MTISYVKIRIGRQIGLTINKTNVSTYNVIISEPCEERTYRNDDMTSCETCDAGLTPNSDKTACGKITLKLIIILLLCFKFE